MSENDTPRQFPADPPTCASCGIELGQRFCRQEKGKGPKNCPSFRYQDLVAEALQEFKANPDVLEFARQASIQESEGYGNKELGYAYLRPIKPRIQEIIEFAQKMNYRRICLAFCVGLRKEAEIVEKIFSDNGFEVISVICKAGSVSKEDLGLLKDQQIDPSSYETMCNPILQAELLNRSGTELNILLGLCVGHDALFLHHASAPCTVLAVKDRVLGHNPLAALYTAGSYHRHLLDAAPTAPAGDER